MLGINARYQCWVMMISVLSFEQARYKVKVQMITYMSRGKKSWYISTSMTTVFVISISPITTVERYVFDIAIISVRVVSRFISRTGLHGNQPTPTNTNQYYFTIDRKHL